MKNKLLKSSFYEKLKFLLILVGVLIGSVSTQMWAKIVYYNDNGQSGTPKVYFWGGSPTTTWGGSPTMTKISGNIYAYDIGTSKNCIFRYNNASSQTGDLTVPTNSNNYMATYNATDKTSWSQLSTFAGDQVLYLLVNSNWKSDNAWFTACFLGVDGQTWVKCSRVGTSDYYSVTVPSGEWPYVIFCRMKSSDTSTKAWSNVWNQTNDLAPSSGNNGVEITGWSNSSNWIVVRTGISVSRTPTAAANAPTITNNQTVVKSGSSVTINAQTEKTGYHWVNWTKTNGTLGTATNKSTTFTPSANSASAVANYAANTYTVAYNANDAQYPGTATGSTGNSSHTYDAAKVLTSNGFSRSGYSFAGWATTPTGSVAYSDGQSVSNLTSTNGATVTLYAKWNENKSTVSLVASPSGKGTFQVGGVTVTSTQAGVTTTPSVTAVPISGYHFVSWAITGGATISSTSTNPTTVTGGGAGTSATLTATFAADAENYTITYGVGTDYTSYGSVSEGHSYSSGSTQASGTEISLTATPETHYKLEGWYTNAACTTAVVGAGTLNPYEFTLGANTSVYAKFILKQCTISLDKNGGSTGAASVTASHGSTLPSFTAHSRTGYTLDGYYTDPSTGTKIINADGSLVASTSYADGSKQWDNDATSLTLYAHWTAKQTTVTLNQQSGSGGTTGVTATYDAAMPDADMPTRTGYDFGGYYTETAGSGTQYYTSGGASARNWDIEDATKTLYAKWTLITYTITYNNMTGATNHPSNPANYNVTTATITLGTPTKAGYDFGGWFTDNGTWKNQVTSIALGSTGNKVLYAKWTAKTYDITYVDANNVATIAANPSTGSTDATINFTVTLKDGYKNLSVTAEDASSNTVTVTNPSSNNYRFTMPASAVTVTVSATALPVVYVLKTKHASSSLGDGATGLPSSATIWAWKASGSNNFYTSPGDFPGPTASSKATAITDDIIGDEWYRFIPDNTSYFDGSTAYHVILTSTGRILDTQSTFIENGSSHSAATHTGTIWIVPHGTDANTAYLYTSYPDEIVTPYNTTYYAGDHGSINVFGTTITSGNSQTIATTKNRTLTATPASGYEFNRWITTGSVTVADATSATTTVSATGAGGTVTATYFETVISGWYITGHPAGDKWVNPTTHPLNRVLPGETNVYYRPVTLPANDQYFRFWCSTGGNHRYGASSNNLPVTKGTKYDLTYDGGNSFKYSAGGTVWFVVDASGATKKFWLQDPVEFYSVNFGYSDGCDEFTAKDGEDHDLVSGNTYVSGTALTFTQTTKDGYTFVGWNTAADGSGSSLGTGSSYTVASLSADVNVYAIYTENLTSITVSAGTGGTVTTGSGTHSLGVATTQAINASANPGYTWSTWTKSGTAVLGTTATIASNTAKGDGTSGSSGTITATFTPNPYTITLKKHNGQSDSSISVTFDANTNLTGTAVSAPEKTGYTFGGYYTGESGAGTKIINADGTVVASANDGGSNTYTDASKNWKYPNNINLHAKWTANEYTVSFDENGGTLSGDGEKTVTYETTATIASCPTAYKDAYCFDGWYTDDSDGELVIAANGAIQSGVTGWTTADGKWQKVGDQTVYAQFSTPTIVLDKSRSKGLINTMPGYDTLLIDQSFSCAPTGDYNVEYTVGYAMSHTPLETQPTIKYGTRVAGVETDTIKMPVADGINTYEVVATLRTGTTRGSGDVKRRDTIRADVETSYSVKIRARVDGVDIADEREARLYPSFAAMGVTIWDTISGYELDSIDYGVGVRAKDTTRFEGRNSSSYIRCYADNPSTITAVYKPMTNTVYFFNYDFEEYDWSYTRAKLYDYGADGYWGAGETAGKGAGSWKMTGDTIKPVDVGSEKWMTSIASASSKFAITYDRIDGHGNFYTYDSPNGTPLPPHVIYRTDFNAATPMFVPVATSNTDYYLMNTVAHYYRGFWVKYSPNPDSTGYFLKVYDKVSGDPAPKLIQSIPLRLTPTGEGGSYELTATMDLEGNKTYGFKFTKVTGAGTVNWYGKDVTLSSSKQYDEGFATSTGNCGLTTTSAGDYTFHVYRANFGSKNANEASADEVQGRWGVKVDFATLTNDYRLLYSDDVQREPIASQTIRKMANAEDTVSFFVRTSVSLPVLKIQKFNGSTWADTATVDLSGITKDSIYVFYLKQSEETGKLSVTGHDYYAGDFYIRTDCVDEHKWDYKHSLDNHKMHETDYGMAASQPFKFSHYYVHWCSAGSNVKYVVATKYSPCLTDTVITDTWVTNSGGNLGSKGANIRFMYNKSTNAVQRDYLHGSEEGDADYLKLAETSSGKMQNSTGSAITSITFEDKGNWNYIAAIKAQPGLRAKLTAEYLDKIQYFLGGPSTDAEILGGTGSDWHTIDMTYDFKTNRLICAWRPDGDSIKSDMAINADVMIIRKAQGDAEQLRFNKDGQLSDVKYIYGVIQFDYNDMFGQMNRWDYWAYMHCMYYISFPYDVLVNDIMGVGQMGVDWRLQRYNGAKRAEKGWFADGEKTFWEDVQEGDTLKAFEGYSLLLNRSRFNGTKGDIWKNKDRGSSVYLYFPSAKATTGIVANDDVTVHVPEHLCTKDQTFVNSSGMTVNHKETDSHWNMIGTPLFEDKVASTITPTALPGGSTLKYIYSWNYFSNTLGISAILNTDFKFKTMYSYMAQFAGDITFNGSTVNKIVAAKRDEEKKNYRLNLELSKDDQFIGRTYVELNENAVDSFALNEDICMFRNGVNADLFTYAGTYEAGANVLPIADQTVQVGVAVKTAGTYVFSMPDSFDGEVTLVDNYAQTRTNLALEDYEIALPTGEITDRFFLEIKINKVPTAIDGAGAGDGSLKDGKAHKFIMNDMMYILKDGVLYDARGNRVK